MPNPIIVLFIRPLWTERILPNRIYVLFLCVLCCIPTSIASTPSGTDAHPVNLYVSPKGRDTWSGRMATPSEDGLDGPLATLSAARDAIRRMRTADGLPVGGVTVWVAAGTYPQRSTFLLREVDSGRKDAPVLYRSMGDGEVRILGGVAITNFKLVTSKTVLDRIDESARDKVVCADLKTAGIMQYGQLLRHDGCEPLEPDPGAMELFWHRRPMTLARWPNTGWANIAGIPVVIPKPQVIQTEPSDDVFDEGAKLLDDFTRDDLEATADHTKTSNVQGWAVIPGKPIPIPGQFTYDGVRPERWQRLDDVWIHGFWMWDWLDSYEKVVAIDTAKHVIVTKPPATIEYVKGRRWYALNILEELDTPGEYYIDRKEGCLFFWPPERDGEALVSTVNGTLVALEGASYVTIRGMTIECVQGNGIDILGGAHNRIIGCTVRNIGTVGVRLYGGSDNGIQSCNIYDCGSGGIRIKGTISGGYREIGEDRKALMAGGLFAENNDIHDYNRTKPVACPGVLIGGVGNRAEHNYIHDAPHMAVYILGNDNQVNFNRIERVCRDTSDAGAIYHDGLDFASLGHQICWNYIADIGGYRSSHHYNGIHGIYLDGYTASGIEVIGNIIVRVPIGIYHGGGRDVNIANNILVGCPIITSNRGLGYKEFSTVETSPMMQKLREVRYNQPPWSTHYPNLVKLPNDQPGAPLRTCVVKNIVTGGQAGIVTPKGDFIRLTANMTDADPGFVDAANDNYQLRDNSPAWKLGFERIPVEKIGLYTNEYRAALLSTQP